LSLKDSLQESKFDKKLVISSLYLKIVIFVQNFKTLFGFAESVENCNFCSDAQKTFFGSAESVENCNFCADAQKIFLGSAESVENCNFCSDAQKTF
jgi:hypothetical protein